MNQSSPRLPGGHVAKRATNVSLAEPLIEEARALGINSSGAVRPFYRPRQGRGYVVDVQADLPERLATRIVVPLVPQPQAEVLRDLMPVIEIAEAMFYSRKN